MPRIAGRAPAYKRRAPLRRHPVRRRLAVPSCVLPPINGGLHCDALLAAAVLADGRVLPPINGGLHCDECFLAYNGAALGVLPPINGGLHCDECFLAYNGAALGVLPPINGGLHCDDQWDCCCLAGFTGAPAYKRRAPLRRGPPGRPSSGRCRAPAYKRRAPLRPHRFDHGRELVVTCSRL